MKPTLFRLGTLAFSFIIGIAISLFFTHYRCDEAALLPVGNGLSPVYASPNELIDKGANVVISVPNDDEFYIGKKKVEPSEISGRIRQLLGNVCLGDRVVFIKGAAKVKFQTLDLIVREARNADVNRIEFVLDKKKPGR